MPRVFAAWSRVPAVASTAPMCAFSSSSRLSAAPTRGVVGRLFGHAQVADFHAFLRADDACSLDDVAQFANVARPAITEQRFARLIAEAARRTRVLFDETCKEPIGEGQDVRRACATAADAG